jgi:hypothetical protein
MIQYDYEIDDIVILRDEVKGKFDFTHKLGDKKYRITDVIVLERKRSNLHIFAELEKIFDAQKSFFMMEEFIYPYNIKVNGEDYYPTYFKNISDERRKKVKRILNEKKETRI